MGDPNPGPLYSFVLSLAAIGSLSVYGCYMAQLGVDKVVAVVVTAAIAGLGGYNLKELRRIVKGGR